MSFGWRDVLNGLDEGLDIAKTIAAIVPGGQGIALGLGALDTVVGKANEVYGVKSLPAPIQTSLDILEGVVKAKDNGTGVKVDNNSVIALLEVVSKSTGNALDDKVVAMVKAYMEVSGNNETNINYNIDSQPKDINQYDTQTQAQLQSSSPLNGETKSGRHFDFGFDKLKNVFTWGKEEPEKELLDLPIAPAVEPAGDCSELQELNKLREDVLLTTGIPIKYFDASELQTAPQQEVKDYDLEATEHELSLAFHQKIIRQEY